MFGTEGIGEPDDYFILNNLIYCLKSASGDHYSIGIAGTDMISPFDWPHDSCLQINSILVRMQQTVESHFTHSIYLLFEDRSWSLRNGLMSAITFQVTNDYGRFIKPAGKSYCARIRN